MAVFVAGRKGSFRYGWERPFFIFIFIFILKVKTEIV